MLALVSGSACAEKSATIGSRERGISSSWHHSTVGETSMLCVCITVVWYSGWNHPPDIVTQGPKDHKVLGTSTVVNVTISSPSLISVKPSSPIPHSVPLRTSFTSFLRCLSVLMTPGTLAHPFSCGSSDHPCPTQDVPLELCLLPSAPPPPRPPC